jgi:hypothetical protein
MYRLRDLTVSPHRLRNCLRVQATTTELHALAVTLQADCNGADPILPVPKTKKIAFWDWGAVFHTDLFYGPVKMWCKKKKKRKISGPGVPPDFAKFLGLAVLKKGQKKFALRPKVDLRRKSLLRRPFGTCKQLTGGT